MPTDSPVFNAKLRQGQLKPCGFFFLLTEQRVGELMTIVGLHLMDFEWRGLDRITRNWLEAY